ncbi:MAG: N-6 DNA methylase [Candidatus Vogelbacteria bacterium]
MDEAEIKGKIKSLVDKYEAVKSATELRHYSEEDTIKDFVLPLFDILGWNTFERKEVSAQEHIKGSGRPDYTFKINGITQFYLEAKKFSADLDDPKFASQAINYSWNKGITYAILTDFEAIKVFNAQRIDKTDLMDKLVFEIPYTKYIEDFETLSLLSKQSFQDKKLDLFAEKYGKKEKTVSVVSVIKKLNEDIQWCRQRLTESFEICNEKENIPKDLLDEGVQKLLDRLIFLRVAEDRDVEPNILKNLLRQAETSEGDTPFQSMVSTFRELDVIYDSNLFSHHPFEEWKEWDGALKQVIEKLYGKKGYYEFNFKEMPADVLGSVYESYLGYKLSTAKSKNKKLFDQGREITIHKDAAKRKEQGIYYTPIFIVDYIVRSALKPVLDKCVSIHELKKIKVLDPACGSGSFLIKALEAIAEKYKELDSGNKDVKRQIILENIYGVDLDMQAVEIARLNLLINSLDTKDTLPMLNKNIKNGNSLLINWQEEFPEVFAQGGFDVIIGNPPYIKEFVNKSAFDGLHDNRYYQGKMDIWTMFACISIDLLKDSGTMSFIAPNNWVSNAGASIFRDKILKEGELKTFIDFGDYKVFEQAGIQTMIYAFEKQKPREKYELEYLRVADKNISGDKIIIEIFGEKQKIEIEPEKLIGKNITFSNSESGSIFDKLESKRNFEFNEKEIGQGIVCPQEYVIDKHLSVLKNTKLGDGIFVLKPDEVKSLSLDQKENKLIKPFYTTEEISRYYADTVNKLWIIYSDREVNKNINKYPKIKSHLQKYTPVITSDFAPFGLHRARDEKFFIGPSLFSIRKTDRPQFSYVDFPCYVSQTYFAISTDRTNLKFLTGLLNSNLIYFWLKNKGKLQGDQLQIDKEPLMGIPICVGDMEQQKAVIALVDRMLSLNKELHEIAEHSEKWENVKSEIEKTDKKIDGEVYKLYDLTEEEIRIIEGK